VLTGEIAYRRGEIDKAVSELTEAVKIEDGLMYMEPPDWPIPVRQLQGAALLELGRAKEAETAFRDDMKKFPDNGWSLSGLEASLEQQKRTADAAAAYTRPGYERGRPAARRSAVVLRSPVGRLAGSA
jgi:Flp pilus assembly protein TadD